MLSGGKVSLRGGAAEGAAADLGLADLSLSGSSSWPRHPPPPRGSGSPEEGAALSGSAGSHQGQWAGSGIFGGGGRTRGKVVLRLIVGPQSL